MNKVEEEKKTIEFMINLYCEKNHKTEDLCQQCKELKEFTHKKIDRCPKKETKTFCSTCTIHCYPKEKREEIRQVMKWAGPRMLWYKPSLALKHIANTIKHKIKNKGEKSK